MATSAKFSEAECLNVYWKIKNFSFCCEKIESPTYRFSGNRYWLWLNSESVDVECRIYGAIFNARILLTREISFVTCDGSPEESISGGSGVTLQVSKDILFGKRRNAFLPNDALTVRIRYLTDSERGKIFISSRIGVKRKYLLWTTKGFSNSQLNPEKSVEKSERYGDIKLTLKSEGGLNSDKKFYIEISRTGGERCYCILKVYVLDADGKIAREESNDFVFVKKDGQHTRMFPAFFKKSDFYACENLLLPEDTLSLKCNFAISLGTLVDQTDFISYNADVTPFPNDSDVFSMTFNEKDDCASATNLQADLKSILENGTLHDVSLQIGSEVIQAHKRILSARSPVFRAMFEKDMKEATSSTVVIEDLDVETVRGLLLYTYTDSIPEEWESMKKLYYAADKYAVLSLKKKCVSFLKTNLSVSNVSEALALADLHQEANLKTAASDFISENDSAVFASAAWKELEKSNYSLALQVLRDICCNKRTG